MYDDTFRETYKEIPIAIFERNAKIHTLSHKLITLAHNHREMELLFVRDGTAIMEIDDHRYDVKPGSLICIPPYCVHHAEIESTGNFSHYCLAFDLSVLHEPILKENLENGMLTISKCINKNNLGKYVSATFNACKSRGPGWTLEATGQLMLLFSCLQKNGFIFERLPQGKHDDFCRNIICYLDKHYNEKITSQDMSKNLFISQAYFCRFFKKTFGIRFQNYLNLFRTERSKKLLAESDIPISQISELVGFSGFSYYSEVFKFANNETPSDYRNRIRKQDETLLF